MSRKVPLLYNIFTDHTCYQLVTETAASVSSAWEARYCIPETQFPKKSLKVSYLQRWIGFLICECFWAGVCSDVKVPTY